MREEVSKLFSRVTTLATMSCSKSVIQIVGNRHSKMSLFNFVLVDLVWLGFNCHNPNENITQHNLNLNTVIGLYMKMTLQTTPSEHYRHSKLAFRSPR